MLPLKNRLCRYRLGTHLKKNVGRHTHARARTPETYRMSQSERANFKKGNEKIRWKEMNRVELQVGITEKMWVLKICVGCTISAVCDENEKKQHQHPTAATTPRREKKICKWDKREFAMCASVFMLCMHPLHNDLISSLFIVESADRMNR